MPMEETRGADLRTPPRRRGHDAGNCVMPFSALETPAGRSAFVILSKKMEQQEKNLRFLWDAAKNFCKNLRKFHFAQELSCCQARRNIV